MINSISSCVHWIQLELPLNLPILFFLKNGPRATGRLSCLASARPETSFRPCHSPPSRGHDKEGHAHITPPLFVATQNGLACRLLQHLSGETCASICTRLVLVKQVNSTNSWQSWQATATLQHCPHQCDGIHTYIHTCMYMCTYEDSYVADTYLFPAHAHVSLPLSLSPSIYTRTHLYMYVHMRTDM